MLARTQTTQTVTVNAPVEMVWAMLDDPESMSALLPKHSCLEMLSDGMASVGSRWRVVVEVGKKRHEALHEVVDAVPKRLHVVRSESDFGVMHHDNAVEEQWRPNADDSARFDRLATRLADAADPHHLRAGIRFPDPTRPAIVEAHCRRDTADVKWQAASVASVLLVTGYEIEQEAEAPLPHDLAAIRVFTVGGTSPFANADSF